MSLSVGTSEIFICPGGINIERLHFNFGMGLVSFASGLCICDVRNFLARLRLLAVVQSLVFPPWGSLSHMLTALLAGHLSPLRSIPWRRKTPGPGSTEARRQKNGIAITFQLHFRITNISPDRSTSSNLLAPSRELILCTAPTLRAVALPT